MEKGSDMEVLGLVFAIAFLILGVILIPPALHFVKKNNWISVAVLILLILSNPSQRSFRNFAQNTDDNNGTLYKRVANYWILSVYEKQYLFDDPSEFYVGFWEIFLNGEL
jgi:hypothetical protein